jgi:hypothetical protein
VNTFCVRRTQCGSLAAVDYHRVRSTGPSASRRRVPRLGDATRYEAICAIQKGPNRMTSEQRSRLTK